MPLKLEPLDEPQLNLTPMIDVVFNLIIFFMVGTRFADMERQFDVQLPQVTAAQPLTTAPDEIIVNLYSTGRIVIAEKDLSPGELRTVLTEARRKYEDQAVLIRAEGQGQVQGLADILAICQGAGIRNYALAAQVKGE